MEIMAFLYEFSHKCGFRLKFTAYEGEMKRSSADIIYVKWRISHNIL